MDVSPEGNRGIDARVGGLVWVRRRNGSWWPGRIMGLDELPESCLVSPRSGTPVKLLGREDGSIDWYNLERSKRVKAFRCGVYEYEDAIEKAKAAVANLNKKAVKYARREDAILHALRLESSFLGKEENRIPIADPVSEHHTDSETNFTLMPEMTRSGLSFQEMSPSTQRRTGNDSEAEESKGMRGLEDLACGGSNPINGFKDHSLPLKRKRSQLAVVHDYLKRKGRHRPLTKVLESTAMLSAANPNDQIESPKLASPAVSLSKQDLELRECNRNGSIVDMSNFDGSPTENWEHALQTDGVEDFIKTNRSECLPEFPESEEFEALLEEPSFLEEKNQIDLQPLQLSSWETRVPHLNGLSVELNHVNRASVHNDGFHESSPHSASVHSNNGAPTAERSKSEWSSKGKRNSRQLARKQSSMKYFDLKEEPKTKRSHQSQESPPPSSSLPSSKADLHPIGTSVSDSALYDVILKAKAGSHRSPHVPLVSLMSKLNGKAVVGHPLSVEALSDGKSNVLTSSLARDTFLVRPQGVAETAYRNNSNKQPKDQQFSSRKSKKRRKRWGALSKKMRELSSLTGKKGRSKLGKPAGDKSEGPVIACIPVKVVFSRISEAVNGSTRSRSTMTANKV